MSLLGTPCITDCVTGELEKLGSKFRVAQRIAKDPRFERLPCTHKGTYADDCLVNRVTQVSVKIGSGGRWYQSDFSLAIACSIIMVAGSNVWSINDNINEGVRDQGSPQRVLERCNTTLKGPWEMCPLS